MEESHIISLKDVDSAGQGSNLEHLFLKSINLSVKTGETVAIIGKTDSGKSALLRCIGLLDRPLTGVVSIDNKNLTFMANSDLCSERRNIGYINSKPTLLNTKTILHNVALPLQLQGYSQADAYKIAAHTLSEVNLDSKTNSLPTQLNNLQIVQLDLARALLNSPKILLADDIFSSLDPKATERLCNLLQTLKNKEKLTLILTTNDVGIIKNFADTVLVMHQGAIVENTTVRNLFTIPQSDVAKEFIRLSAKHELPGSMRRKLNQKALAQHHAVVRINFEDCLAPEEILTNALDAFELRMNIIQAYQELISGAIINLMIIEIFGEFDVVQDAVEFLSRNGLHSEIIGYVPDTN